MDIRTSAQNLGSVQTDVLALFLAEGESLPLGLAGATAQIVHKAREAGDFKAGFGETALFYSAGDIAARKLLLCGLGNASKLDIGRLRRAAGIAARAGRQTGAKALAITVPSIAGIAPAKAGQMVAEGALHGLFRFKSFKSEAKPQAEVESLVLIASGEAEAGVATGKAIAQAVNLARAANWLPGNHLTATNLADLAQTVCRESGIEITVHDKAGCKALGLGLLLAVNQGSVEEPRFVVMRYKGNGGQGPWLGLVGKGVTFDSGGISLKQSENMWDMKHDMSGAGAVLGAMQAIAAIKPKADIMAVLACTDNLPDGGAYKPGDVIAGLSGKTVEIRSTDAEGRLVLSDGLAYAVKQGCTKLITASTLTGAVNIALGPQRYGIVSNNDEWEARVFQAAEEAGERGWRLPHDDDYYDLFKSPIADMSNSGTGRSAGTVVGGLFLMRHVDGTPCVHLDIAAQAWVHKRDDYEDEGATGVAVRTFVQAAVRFAEEN